MFVSVGAFTPGPNNAMLLASGLNFGFRRTLPHLAGVVLGYGLMMFGVAVGLGALFAAFPALQVAVQVAGAGYMLYLAWRIATSTSVGGAEGRSRPIRFLEAAAFQWVNPKAVVSAISTPAAFAPKDRYLAGSLLIILVAMGVSVVSAAAWAGLGTSLRRLLERPRARAVFNGVLAAALVASLIPLGLELLRSL